MIAQSFTVQMQVAPIRAGLATATTERIAVGGETIEIARVRITAAGRQALAR
jgi:hypothetical protein